jgi:uncharacterized integral membrane protein
MQFLKTLFWVALAIVLVLFASVNWTSVTIALWGGLEADVKLPVLVFAAFLLGFLPMLILHRARMWSQRRRLENLERQAALLHTPQPAPHRTDSPETPAAAPSATQDTHPTSVP